MMLRRWIACCLILIAPLSWADWAADRDGSAGYVTVTTLASVIDEAVPFIYVKGSDLPSEFHAAMDAASDTDGKTIRFSTADGSTQLACVVVGVDTGANTFAFFGLGTGMSASTDVDYRIYVGNASLSMPSDSGGMGCQAVFAAYAGVYMPGVSTKDWTSGGRALTAVNSPGTAASSMEGVTAATYNGTSQYHTHSGTQAVTGNLVTIEAMAYSTTTSTGVAQTIAQLIHTSNSNSILSLAFRDDLAGNTLDFLTIGNGGTSHRPASTIAYSASTWHYTAGVRTTETASGDTVVYLDGGNSATSTGTMAAPYSRSKFNIGAWNGSSVIQYLNGRVAVVLLSTSARSADFIATNYDNFNGDLYSVGSWTAASSCNSGSTGWVLFQTAATTSASGTLVDWTNVNNAKVDDSNFASATLDPGGNFESEYLNLTNIAYGTTPPVGADSYTVTVRIKRSRGTGVGDEINDLTVQFIDETGTRIGDNKADGATNWPTTAASVDYTITGHTFDGTEFDADSGLAIRATATDSATDCDAKVLVAWIKIDWDCGDDPAANSRGFFALTE